MKNHNFYYQHIGDLKRRLGSAMPREELRDLHRVSATRHFLVVARLLALTGLCAWALWQNRWTWLWPLAAIVQGFNILGFVILLHEQVHRVIFQKRRPHLEALLGHLYALPSGISATQFRIWHLDHHNELGSETDDPKRAHLSPKRNSRWTKLLYFTPYLFVLYARAALREAKGYSPDDQRAVRRERLTNGLLHLAAAIALLTAGGPLVLLRVYVIPLFFIFPIAFVLNRLGQHYDIDPQDPAKWSTRVDGNPIWHTLMLWSNFHIEHHYYQRVPFYNLKRLNRDLRPFWRGIGLENRTYSRLLKGWLIDNRQAHTNWSPVEE